MFKKVAKNTWTILILCIFSLIIIQPDKFAVAYKPSNDSVYAAYADLLQQADQQDDGALHFETLVVGGDQDPQLIYIVRAGDTLSDIAKTFGTTTTAIMEANGMKNPSELRAGKRITITYKEGVIHEIKKSTSIEQFAKEYNLNLDDLLTLNYIDDPKAPLQVGQQIFLDLNRVEAEEKGLVEKREFQALDLGWDEVMADSDQPEQPIAMNMPDEKPIDNSNTDGKIDNQDDEVLMEQAPRVDNNQQIITAEQTEQHLKNLSSQKEQAKIAHEEAQKAAEREAQDREQQQITKKANAAAAVAQAKAEAEKINQQEAKKQEEAGITCEPDQCLHDGVCWNRPENAYCTPEDGENAWICKEGFTDTGKACVVQESEKSVQKKVPFNDKIWKIVKQRYFNPYKAGYNNGWGGWYCTHYAGYYRWKEYGISTNWRGNARQWYKNASAAGWAVGQTPEIGSIIVMRNGVGGWSSYGHVGIVISIDWDNSEILIEDMNYVGRYIASQHWISMDSTTNPIIGYIYPRAQ